MICATCNTTTNERDPADVCHCERCEGCDARYDARFRVACERCDDLEWEDTPNGQAEAFSGLLGPFVASSALDAIEGVLDAP